jgi:uncharacterized membrane protein
MENIEEKKAPWKSGLFYYDPGNPKIFIIKRSGLGYTLNFGHKVSWFIIAFLIGLIIYILVKRNSGTL